MQFKKILAPVDFSRASKNGFNCARRFAEEFGAELTALYVLEPAPAASFMAMSGVIPFCQTDFSWAEKNLRALIACGKNGSAEEPAPRNEISTPDSDVLTNLLRELRGMLEADSFDLNAILLMILEAMYRGVGLDRALFCLLDGSRAHIEARLGVGADVEALIEK